MIIGICWSTMIDKLGLSFKWSFVSESHFRFRIGPKVRWDVPFRIIYKYTSLLLRHLVVFLVHWDYHEIFFVSFNFLSSFGACQGKFKFKSISLRHVRGGFLVLRSNNPFSFFPWIDASKSWSTSQSLLLDFEICLSAYHRTEAFRPVLRPARWKASRLAPSTGSFVIS